MSNPFSKFHPSEFQVIKSVTKSYFLRNSIQLLNLALAKEGVSLGGSVFEVEPV